MFAKQIILAAATLLLLTGSVVGQGEFLRPGEDGFGITSQVNGGNNNGGYGFGFGYSVDGALDLSFSYVDNSDINTKVYCPSITFYRKGVTEKSVYGFAMTGGYVEATRGSKTSKGLLIALGLFVNFYSSEILMIQPSVTGSLTVNADDTDDQFDESGTAGLALVFALTTSFRPFVNAGITVADNLYYNVGIGFLGAW